MEQDRYAEMQRCLEKTRAFCHELSDHIHEALLELLEQCRRERRPMSKKIIDYLLEKKMILPTFEILSQTQAEKFIKDNHL